MKKILSLFLTFLMVVSVVSVGTTFVNAEEQHENGFYYSIINDEATITDFDTSISGNVIIPSTLGGYPVTRIGESAFENCDLLISITIPDGVISIGDDAFCGCTSLTSVSIPDSVTSVGEGAFENCTSLTNVTIPDSVTTIGNGAFSNCSYLETVKLSNSLTSLGQYAFKNCSKLRVVILGQSLIRTNGVIFDGCTSLGAVHVYNNEFIFSDTDIDNLIKCSGVYIYCAENSKAYKDTQDIGLKHYLYPTPVIIDNAVALEDEKVVNNKDNSYKLPEIKSEKGIAYTDGSKYYLPGHPVSGSKEYTTVYWRAQMQYGASLRLNDAGLRFYTENVNEDFINRLSRVSGYTVKLGTLIAPRDYLNETGENLTHNLGKGKFLDVSYDYSSGFWNDANFKGFVGSIIKIIGSDGSRPDGGNVPREFVGRGYITVTGNGISKTVYADYCNNAVRSNSRSVANIAWMIQNDENAIDIYEAFQDNIDRWAEFRDVD